MDELITLNQLKEYDAAKANILNNKFDNVYNYVNDGLNNVQFNVVDNNVLDLSNHVNNVHNELNEAYNNFGTDNLVANNAQINSLNVIDIIANGSTGTDGQVIGKENGNINWINIPDPIDADNFTVNNITINNGAILNGFNIASIAFMSEDDYNNLGSRSPSLFYFTTPNGNLYLKGFGYSPNILPSVYSVWVNLRRLDREITTHSLVSGDTTATNNFVNGSAIYGVQQDGSWNNAVSIGVNTYGDTLRTNADELYILNASYMYNNCKSLTDTFICNPSLIIGSSENYTPMKYCTDMSYTFSGCSNFNQPVTIPDNVTNMFSTFNGCSNFNQPVTIPDNVVSMSNTFSGCSNFNQPVIIGNNVTNMSGTFNNCSRFNQPVTIPDNVVSMFSTFNGCHNFNQPVTIPDNVVSMSRTFSSCYNFNQPVTIPDNVTDMTRTFSSCSSFNQPVTIPDNVTSMSGTFSDCSNFNQPVTIPDNVTNISNTFSFCYNLNQPVTIPDNVVSMSGTFNGCHNFNQLVIIGNNVTNMFSTFSSCSSFNQPVTIPDNVTDISYTFNGCSNFNQPVTIPDNVVSISRTFYGCTTLNSSTVPIHISSSITLGDTSNYIYNSLINGECGIAFAPSRILNDA